MLSPFICPRHNIMRGCATWCWFRLSFGSQQKQYEVLYFTQRIAHTTNDYKLCVSLKLNCCDCVHLIKWIFLKKKKKKKKLITTNHVFAVSEVHVYSMCIVQCTFNWCFIHLSMNIGCNMTNRWTADTVSLKQTPSHSKNIVQQNLSLCLSIKIRSKLETF